MRFVLVLLLIAGCRKRDPEPASQVPAPIPTRAGDPSGAQPDPGPSADPPRAPDLEELQAVARALSVRDPAPVCAEVLQVVPDADPVATWLYVVETVSMPPYAPMRAGSCLVEDHAADAAEPIVGWIRDPAKEGLARMVLARLDRLPEAVAVGVVRAGLDGPLAEDFAEAARNSEQPAVRALVSE